MQLINMVAAKWWVSDPFGTIYIGTNEWRDKIKQVFSKLGLYSVSRWAAAAAAGNLYRIRNVIRMVGIGRLPIFQ